MTADQKRTPDPDPLVERFNVVREELRRIEDKLTCHAHHIEQQLHPATHEQRLKFAIAHAARRPATPYLKRPGGNC